MSEYKLRAEDKTEITREVDGCAAPYATVRKLTVRNLLADLDAAHQEIAELRADLARTRADAASLRADRTDALDAMESAGHTLWRDDGHAVTLGVREVIDAARVCRREAAEEVRAKCEVIAELTARAEAAEAMAAERDAAVQRAEKAEQQSESLATELCRERDKTHVGGLAQRLVAAEESLRKAKADIRNLHDAVGRAAICARTADTERLRAVQRAEAAERERDAVAEQLGFSVRDLELRTRAADTARARDAAAREALRVLEKVISDRHLGRMPDEVQKAVDAARAVLAGTPGGEGAKAEEHRVEAAMDRAGWGGLYRKYDVRRVHDPAGKHRECEYFVLDWRHDPFAVPAARAYADACEAQHADLARDLRAKADEHALREPSAAAPDSCVNQDPQSRESRKAIAAIHDAAQRRCSSMGNTWCGCCGEKVPVEDTFPGRVLGCGPWCSRCREWRSMFVEAPCPHDGTKPGKLRRLPDEEPREALLLTEDEARAVAAKSDEEIEAGFQRFNKDWTGDMRARLPRSDAPGETGFAASLSAADRAKLDDLRNRVYCPKPSETRPPKDRFDRVLDAAREVLSGQSTPAEAFGYLAPDAKTSETVGEPSVRAPAVAVANVAPASAPKSGDPSGWRVGRTLGRTLYRDGVFVGMVDTPEIAREIVEAMDPYCDVCGGGASGEPLRTPVEVCRDCYDIARDPHPALRSRAPLFLEGRAAEQEEIVAWLRSFPLNKHMRAMANDIEQRGAAGAKGG